MSSGPATRVGMLVGLPALTSFGISAVPIVLPQAADDLGVTAAAAAWLLVAFALAQGAVMPVAGRAIDLAGSMPVAWLGAVLLAAGTAGCIAGETLASVAIARAVQGAGTSLMCAVAFTVIGSRLEPPHRAAALGRLTTLSGIALAGGPLVGACAALAGGWRAALVLPVGGLLAVPAARRAASPPTATAERIDVVGAALFLAAGTGALTVLQAHATAMSTGVTAAAAAVAVLAGALLAAHTRRSGTGLVPLELLRNVRLRRLALTGAGINAGFVGLQFVAPLLLHAARPRLGPVGVGALLLPAAAVAMVAAWRAATTVLVAGAERIQRLVAVGVLVAAGGIGVAAGEPAVVIVAAAAGAAAFGASQVAVLETVSAVTPGMLRGTAIGFVNLSVITGGAVGVAAAAAAVDAGPDLLLALALAAGPGLALVVLGLPPVVQEAVS